MHPFVISKNMKIIDADAHFTPILPKTKKPLVNSWIEQYLLRKQGMFSDPKIREAELQMLGVNRQLLNPMGPSLKLNYSIEKTIAKDIMQLYNDTMYSISQKFSCFDINIWLALQDLNSSLDELDRFDQKKFFGVHVSETPLWGFLNDFDVLWQKISEKGIPWYMHLTNSEDVLPDCKINHKFLKYTNFWKRSHWQNSIASFILGGVLDRFPNLKVVVVERDINWIQNFVDDFKILYQIDALPYIKKNFWFTIEPEMPNFLVNASYVGFDRLLFATDWPHDFDVGGKNSRHDVKTIKLLSLDQCLKYQIFYKNYELLGQRL